MKRSFIGILMLLIVCFFCCSVHAEDSGAYGFDIPLEKIEKVEESQGAYGFDIPLATSKAKKNKEYFNEKERGIDKYGNPKNNLYGLGEVDNDLLTGEKILLYAAYNGQDEGGQDKIFEWHYAQNSVKERNMTMDILIPEERGLCSLTYSILSKYNQLWFVSDKYPSLSNEQVNLISRFVQQGNGLLIWADNEPYYADANLLANRIAGTCFSGNKHGDMILKQGKSLSPGCFIEHPLTQGVNKLYEGITISTISPAKYLTVLAKSHDGQNCMACYEKGNQRVVLDTGFTKLIFGRFHNTPGTARYFRNIAFWLAKGTRKLQYTLLTPGRENTATIKTGEESKHYKFETKRPTEVTTMLFWSGKAKLELNIKDPGNKIVYNKIISNNEVRVSFESQLKGYWECWVKGIDVPNEEQEYVLIVRKRDKD